MNLSIGFCYLQLISTVYGVNVLMGAPVLTDVMRIFLFSICIVFIGFTPIIFSLKGNLKEIYDFVFQNEFYLTILNSKKKFFMKNLVWGTIIGAWLGAIPIPLDWDRWWQRWPITCLVSSTIGAGLSIIISYLWLWIRKRQKFNEDIEITRFFKVVGQKDQMSDLNIGLFDLTVIPNRLNEHSREY